ncbi:hypothetical protein NSERUTF1_0855 [Nocardia seriolae]|nr:hypothetical protein NSERUTF1_0855 [Nocardia seriolae]
MPGNDYGIRLPVDHDLKRERSTGLAEPTRIRAAAPGTPVA